MALPPNWSDETVSSTCSRTSGTQTTSEVLALPPMASCQQAPGQGVPGTVRLLLLLPSSKLPVPFLACSILVSLESRKGTWVAEGSALALMHMPSAVRLRLIDFASLALGRGREGGQLVRRGVCCSPLASLPMYT